MAATESVAVTVVGWPCLSRDADILAVVTDGYLVELVTGVVKAVAIGAGGIVGQTHVRVGAWVRAWRNVRDTVTVGAYLPD